MRKYALISGASSGIGESMARYAAEQGCDVGLTARRVDRLEALAHELIEAHGVEADVFPKDLCKPGSADDLADEIKGAGRDVDILVNNAGMSIARGFAGTDVDAQRRFVELTATTPMALAHAFLPKMLEKGWGRIINISSITALSSGGKGHTLYPAAKAFLLKFSQSLNAEVASRGVNVTAVLPGFVETEFQQANGIADQMDGTTRRFAQTAREVAEEAWLRNEKGVEIVVPGFLPKIAASCLRYFPEQIVRAMTRPAAAKYYVGD